MVTMQPLLLALYLCMNQSIFILVNAYQWKLPSVVQQRCDRYPPRLLQISNHHPCGKRRLQFPQMLNDVQLNTQDHQHKSKKKLIFIYMVQNIGVLIPILLFMNVICFVDNSSLTIANALQPRNEPLCSTGLFENFMEYKCTPIGDISDEGISKDLSNQEKQITDSLFSKMMIDDATRNDDRDKDAKKGNAILDTTSIDPTDESGLKSQN